MRAKTTVRVVVEPPNRGVLDGPVHPFDLAVRPRVVELREAMVDAQLGTGQIKGVGSEWPSVRQQLLNLFDRPATLRRRELKAVIREHGVNAVRHVFHKPSQEIGRNPARGLSVELREGELADTIDGEEQIQPALFGRHLRQVEVDVPERICPELPACRWVLDARKTTNPVTLEKPMQRRACEMWDRCLKGVEAIIERQQRVSTKRH